MTDNVGVSDEKLLEEVLRGIRQMREDAARQQVDQFRFLQEEAQESGDARERLAVSWRGVKANAIETCPGRVRA